MNWLTHTQDWINKPLIISFYGVTLTDYFMENILKKLKYWRLEVIFYSYSYY